MADILLAFFALTIVGNLSVVWTWYVTKRHSSLVLIAGGVAGMLGLRVAPDDRLARWWWMPLMADICIPYGTALGVRVSLLLVHLLRRAI